MTFNQIRYFIKLAECLSFTEAARCLFITQPALSRQIAVMEEELGTALFIRDKKKLKLTPGGLVLFNRLPAVLAEYESAVTEASSANQGFEGTLKIGILDIYDITKDITEIVTMFRKRHPDIELSLERLGLGQLPKKLYDASMDLILTYSFSLFDQPDILTAFIRTFNSCIMLPKEHPYAKQKRLTLSDLKDETFIQLGPKASSSGYQYILNLCSRCGFSPTIRKVEKMEDVTLWLQTGSGVAITTDCTIEQYNPSVILRPIRMPEAEGHEVCLAWHKNNHNPAIAIFLELADRYINKEML